MNQFSPAILASIKAKDPARFAALNPLSATPGDVPAKSGQSRGGTAALRKSRAKRVLTCHAKIDPEKVSTLILIPGMKLESEANRHTHWRDRQARAKQQRSTVAMHLIREIFPPLPIICRIVRVGPRMLDSDNAEGSAKSCRDAIAAHYGVDDGKAERQGLIKWDVFQDRGPYGVRIEIERKP